MAARRELGLADLVAYRAYLEEHPGEWALLDSMTRITISRFCRDRGVFGFLEQEVLPMLAAEAVACDSGTLEVWSAGCASGEEPYTVALIWQLELTQRFSDFSIQILATDLDQTMLTRARRALLHHKQPQGAARALAHCGLPTAGGAALRARPLQASRDGRTPRHSHAATAWPVRSGDVPQPRFHVLRPRPAARDRRAAC